MTKNKVHGKQLTFKAGIYVAVYVICNYMVWSALFLFNSLTDASVVNRKRRQRNTVAQKSKPLPIYEKVASNRIKVCQ